MSNYEINNLESKLIGLRYEKEELERKIRNNRESKHIHNWQAKLGHIEREINRYKKDLAKEKELYRQNERRLDKERDAYWENVKKKGGCVSNLMGLLGLMVLAIMILNWFDCRMVTDSQSPQKKHLECKGSRW